MIKKEQTEPYQKAVKSRHKRMKIKLIGLGGNKKKEKGFKSPNMERSKSAPPIGEEELKTLTEQIHTFFGYQDFNIKEELDQKFWQDPNKLDKEVRDTLEEIARDFFKTLKVKAELIDITFTGSMANYNYAEESDIDLHILLDFRRINDRFTFLKDYFTSKKNEWNRRHNILIKGREVEVYVQDINEPHASTGVYSLLYDRWLIRPTKKKVKVDSAAIYKKAADFGNMINDALSLYSVGRPEEAHKEASRLMEKIKKFRRCGLEKGGEFSTENLVFKSLRNSGYLKKLSDLKGDSYDKMMSIAGKRDSD